MAVPQLCDVDDLATHGLSWAFLEQFRPRPIEVEITTAGALATMAWRWRWRDTDDWSDAITSGAATYEYRLEEAYAVLTFAAGTYVVDTSYYIDEDGDVTREAGAIDTLTAERFDLREEQIDVASSLAFGWMAPVVTPDNLTSWGVDIRRQTARLAAILLKKIRGIAPSDAAPGDAVLLADEETLRLWFVGVGRGAVRPPDLVTAVEPATPVHEPVSDDLRGW